MRIVLGLWLFALGATTAFAGNRHEHLVALASYDGLSQAYDEWKNRPPGYPNSLQQFTLTRLMRDPLRTLRDIYGDEAVLALAKSQGLGNFKLGEAMSKQAFNEAMGKLSISDLGIVMAKVIPKYRADEVTRGLFEFTPATRAAPGSYQAMEELRRDFLINLKNEAGVDALAELWESAMRKTAKDIPYEERSLLDLSVPKELFHPKMYVATANGMDSVVNFYLSLPRGQLESLKPVDLETEIASVEQAMKEGWAHGFDISGSIQEGTRAEKDLEAIQAKLHELRSSEKSLNARADRAANQARALKADGQDASELEAEASSLRREAKANATEARALEADRSSLASRAEKLKIRLKQILTAAGKHEGDVRLHMFESGRTGPFYVAVKQAIEELAAEKVRMPRQIRVGHVAAMTDADIDAYEALAKLPEVGERLVFEANPVSNHVLHGVPYPKLVDIISKLIARGFPVMLGADEQGILGVRARMWETFGLLWREGMTDAAVAKLLGFTTGMEIRASRLDRAADQMLCVMGFRRLVAGASIISLIKK